MISIQQSQYIAGKTHPDSNPEIDDGKTVLVGCTVWKISKIRLLHDIHLVGMEIYYKIPGGTVEISSGLHRGSDETNNPKEYIIEFDDDEFITSMKIYASEIIDGIKFKTNKNKEHRFKSKLGKEYKWTLPNGYHFNLMKFHTNGHIHQIKACYSMIPFASFQKRINQIGGANFYLGLAFTGSILPQRTISYGVISEETKHFDDFLDYIPYCTSKPELSSFIIYHDHKSVFGVELQYKIKNQIHYGGIYQGKNAKVAMIQKAILNLNPGETITEINGEYDNYIKHLRVQTNKGRFLDVGGTGTSKFSYEFVGVQQCISVGGGYADYLDNLYFYYL